MKLQELINNPDINQELISQIREEAFQEQAEWAQWVASQMGELNKAIEEWL